MVSLSAPEIVAALYAFSDLADDVTNHDLKSIRDDLCYVVARYGTALIECAAEWLEMSGPASIPWFLAGIGLGPHHTASADRLCWCREQSLLLLRAEAA